MRILFSVHLYPPTHNCGGEYYIHNLAKWLISRGHICRVLLHQGMNYGITEPYLIDNVDVFPVKPGDDTIPLNLMRWCEVAFTHLEYTNWTIQVGRVFKKPVVQIVHNDTPYDCVLGAFQQINIVYNSQWIADKLKYKHRSMVMTPPVDIAHYDVGRDPWENRYITLINCNENKGGKIFSEIARRMPNRNFLAVRGSYEEQFIAALPNVTIHPNTPNILPIYEITRILLMPSKYESWGMTASEAMCNGIPVICTKTPGLLENTGGKMLYCERDDIDGWIDRINGLDNKATYSRYSNAGRARAKELEPTAGYEKLEAFMYGAV